MTEVVIRRPEAWAPTTAHLDAWLNGGCQQWRIDVGDDLLGGYARLVENRR